MLSGPRESFVRVQGWHRGMRDRLVVDWGRGGAPQPAVEDLVGALGNGVMTTSAVYDPRDLGEGSQGYKRWRSALSIPYPHGSHRRVLPRRAPRACAELWLNARAVRGRCSVACPGREP